MLAYTSAHYMLVKRCIILSYLIGALKESCLHTMQNYVEHQVGRMTSSAHPTTSYHLSSQCNAVGLGERNMIVSHLKQHPELNISPYFYGKRSQLEEDGQQARIPKTLPA